MSTTAGTSLKQWQDNWAECNRRYVAMATENESLQSQLAAANERADAAVKALAYVIRDLEIRAGTSGVVELGHGAYLQAKRVLDQNV